jgi:hypothetical protein
MEANEMRQFNGMALAVLSLAIGACNGGAARSNGTLTITTNTTGRFEATYELGKASATLVGKLQPTSTNIYHFYEITTSFGSTLVMDGITDKAAPEDARDRINGVIVLGPKDPEYALAHGLMDTLIDLGANPSPSAEERATPLYGLAYNVAQVLGLTASRLAFGMTQADLDAVNHHKKLPDVWPYPSADGLNPDQTAAFKSKIKALGGEDFYGPWIGLDPCCGDQGSGNGYSNGNCKDLAGNTGQIWGAWGWSCGDWCEAGDHCVAYHAGIANCGNWTDYFPGGATCPHMYGNFTPNCDAAGYNAWNYSHYQSYSRPWWCF